MLLRERNAQPKTQKSAGSNRTLEHQGCSDYLVPRGLRIQQFRELERRQVVLLVLLLLLVLLSRFTFFHTCTGNPSQNPLANGTGNRSPGCEKSQGGAGRERRRAPLGFRRVSSPV